MFFSEDYRITCEHLLEHGLVEDFDNYRDIHLFIKSSIINVYVSGLKCLKNYTFMEK